MKPNSNNSTYKLWWLTANGAAGQLYSFPAHNKKSPEFIFNYMKQRILNGVLQGQWKYCRFYEIKTNKLIFELNNK